MTGKLMSEVRQSGFDAPEEVVHLFVGGSELHGAKVGATCLCTRCGGGLNCVDASAISELIADVHLAALGICAALRE